VNAQPDPGASARDYYARRVAQIDRWLGRRPWTATDWELAGARVLLQRALVAEGGQPIRWPVREVTR
jgi:hypothetical protein